MRLTDGGGQSSVLHLVDLAGALRCAALCCAVPCCAVLRCATPRTRCRCPCCPSACAGSERIARSEVQGQQLKEAQAINKSLSALGDVISALQAKSAHTPYRNSKLTQARGAAVAACRARWRPSLCVLLRRSATCLLGMCRGGPPPRTPVPTPATPVQVLQDSLCGSSKVLLVCCVSPEPASAPESLSSLQFASRAAQVCRAGQAHAHGGRTRMQWHPSSSCPKPASRHVPLRPPQVELGPVRKAADGTPGGAKKAAAAPGQSPLTPGAARSKLTGTPQSGARPRSALRDANAH